MTVAYATAEELVAFLPTGTVLPSSGEQARLLARASELLDDVIREPFVVVDGLPSDTDLAGALVNACCAQVEQWLEVGEHNDIDGLAGDHTSLTGFSGHRAPRLAPRAVRFLRVAGLLDVQVYPAGTLEGAT